METRTRKNNRRSSILKRSPSRNEIDLDYENTCVLTENTAHRRFSKRVSFANSHQIKEIIRATDIAQDWHDSNSDCDTSKLSDVSNLMQPLPERQSLPIVSSSKSTDCRLQTITDEGIDMLNMTSGSCDMDMTNISSSNLLGFSSRATARPGLLSFFDNSTLNIGGTFTPSPEESPRDPGKIANAEQSQSNVHGKLTQKKNDGIKLQDFLQSVKSIKSSSENSNKIEEPSLPVNHYPNIPPPSYYQNECFKGKSSQSLLMGPQVTTAKPTTDAELDKENGIHLQQENVNLTNLDTFTNNECENNLSTDVTKIFSNVKMDFTECCPISIVPALRSTQMDNTVPSEDDTTDVPYEALSASNLDNRDDVTKIFKTAEDIQMDFTECAFGSVSVPPQTCTGLRNGMKTVESSLSPCTRPIKHESDVTTMSVGQMDFTECLTVQVISSELPGSKQTGKVQGSDKLNSSLSPEKVLASPCPDEKTRHFVQDQDDEMEFTEALSVIPSFRKTSESGDGLSKDDDAKTRHFMQGEDNNMDFTEACIVLVQERPIEIPQPDVDLTMNDEASRKPNKPSNEIPNSGNENSANYDDIQPAMNSDNEDTFTNVLSMKRKISHVRNSIGIYKAKNMRRSATSSSDDYKSPQEDIKDVTDSSKSLCTSELVNEVFTKDCSPDDNIRSSTKLVCPSATGELEKLPGNNTFVATKNGKSSRVQDTQGTTVGVSDPSIPEATSEHIHVSKEDMILGSQLLFDEITDDAEDLADKESSRILNEPKSASEEVQIAEDVECPDKIRKFQEPDFSQTTSEIILEQQELKEYSKDSEETDLRPKQISLDKSLMASLNLQQSQKHVENISVEEFLNLAKLRIWSKQWKNLGRQSNIMPEPKKPPESLFELFLAVKLKGAELSLQEWFVESMEKTSSWLEEEISKKEEKMSAKNPEIFHNLRLGNDNEELIEGIRKMSNQQKSLAKAYWNFDVSKLKKGLCKDAEIFLDEELLPFVNKLGQPQKLLDLALAEIEEGNRQLDALLSELEGQDQSPSQCQADEYEMSRTELDHLDKRYASFQLQKASHKEHEEECRKRQTKLLNELILKDDDDVRKKQSSLKKAICDYEKHLQWHLLSLTQRSIEFGFFSGTFVIHVLFETEWNSSANAKAASYTVRSVISNDNVIKSEIATYQMIHCLIKRHVMAEDFINIYPDFRSLRLMLQSISCVASAAEEMLSDIDWISCQVSSCSCDVLLHEECIVISFLPPVLGIDRFKINFHFSNKESLVDLSHNDLLQLVNKNGFRFTDLEYVGGRRQLEYMNDKELKELCKSVSPGHHHLKRTVQEILTKLNYQM